jgi:hypothetical protein
VIHQCKRMLKYNNMNSFSNSYIISSLGTFLILSSYVCLELLANVCFLSSLTYDLFRVEVSTSRQTPNPEGQRLIFVRTILSTRAGIATSYGLDDREVGVQVPVMVRIFTSPNRPNRLWGPPNLLCNGYRGLFPRG